MTEITLENTNILDLKKMQRGMDILKDTRVDCYSVIIQLTVKEYLDLVENVFKQRGGLEGQRDTLKTTTAIRIRERMVKDLKSGAVLPPIVLGVIVSENDFKKLAEDHNHFFEIIKNISNNSPESISIIDGMQRTSALFDASKDENIGDHKIRVEYWISSRTNSLTYRMLVLNTGQVPWNIRRQIEIVFRPIIKELKQKYNDIDIMEINDERRRSNSGQFQAGNVIELFLVFGARKEKIDVQERLADEFTKQDFIESTSNPGFTERFYDVMHYLSTFDNVISIYQGNLEGNFKEGKDLFSSQPACVGFVTAIALSVMGRPGLDYDQDQQSEKWDEIKNNLDQFLKRLTHMGNNEIGNFLDFQTLNELIKKRSGKSSYFERAFFLEAFKVLIEEDFDLPSMTPCWRAY